METHNSMHQRRLTDYFEGSAAGQEEVPGNLEEHLRDRHGTTRWTRVKARDQLASAGVPTWEIVTDLLADRCKVGQLVGELGQHGVVLFNPDTYRAIGNAVTKAAYRLSQEELRRYGQMATEVRAALRARAAELAEA
jgi:hypothetical protein